jgi:hypothetical protein
MRLVCLHADTVDALRSLNIQFDDLTPNGLWSSQYHLVGLTPDQIEALEAFDVEAEDITPAQLAQAVDGRTHGSATGIAPAAEQRSTVEETATAQGTAGGQRPAGADRPATPAPMADSAGREPTRVAGGESEVPLAQARDTGARPADTKAEARPEGKTGAQPVTQAGASLASAAQTQTAQQATGQRAGKGAPPVTAPAQGNRKGQPTQPQPVASSGGQRYGTTRLRISVAGKYTEATVANGKIVVAGRSYDTPDQAAADLTKSRGDWTFWEYYDSTDGKWRMLTRDWDTVLKSATPGGR